MFGRQLERELLAVLADEGPLYVVDLAATVDEHPVTVEHACDRLRDDGDIRSVGGRQYEVTASGHRRLADTEPTPSGSSRSDASGMAD
ncbi:MarR family transcriptional regulator [Haloarchaeobius amylolyticus]|uniref:MarR family transcriptional regulator n=1 Tax=Haloarchaeobius amylolyticus TaxID=1198296 RepID=A0ABD6BGJ5_9EURY